MIMGRKWNFVFAAAVLFVCIVPWLAYASAITPKVTPILLAEIKDNAVTVDDNALYRLMKRDELQDKPLVILSIAGKKRTGKSFIMNLFVRYLRFKGWENPNWFYDEEIVVDDFKYQTGPDVATHGIMVHPDIFQMPLKDGTQAAVLLLDTQGLYDGHTSSDCNAKLMALSTLLCSHQILNSIGDVDSRDLEHLWLSIEMAEFVSKAANENHEALQVCTNDSCDTPSDSEERSPASKVLSFLIRDWQWEEQYAFGSSTDGYLKKFLHEASQSEEVQKVKDHINTTFRTVNAYLLPHPGKKVAKSNGNLRNSDMDEDFVEKTKLVIESIMNKENLAVKRSIGGNAISVRELLISIAQIGKTLKQGKFGVEAAYRALRRGILDSLRIAKVKKYEAMMNEMCKEQELFQDDKLQLFHAEAFDRTKTEFGEGSKSVKDEKLVKEYLQTLELECNRTFSSIKRDIAIKKGHAIQRMTEAIRKLAGEYKEKTGNAIAQATTEEELRKLLETKKQEAMTAFESQLSNNSLPELKGELDGQIDDITESAVIFLQRNIESQQKNAERKKTIWYELAAEFNKENSEFFDQYYEKLDETLRESERRYMERYDEEMERFDDRTSVSEYRGRLQSDIRKISASLSENNSKNKETVRQRSKLLGMELARKMESGLQEQMRDSYIDPTTLKTLLRDLVSGFRESLSKLPTWAREIAEEEIGRMKQKLLDENEYNKNRRSVFLEVLEALAPIAIGIFKLVFTGDVSYLIASLANFIK